ncbi:integrase [Thiohalobacter thiocyanaticus]|uniref:Integrase n=1 Tax=Thiohalobacter thiocyanaticus TaxID=585455 RepID=A0A1Z4VQZ4_9GAMM|nr:integrase arm-type DNA-binding domain-containing protein [Thiohalobacter thiocyanaticus]BAZ94070.1 integrase [Thiohalobacter thiocyanaticus]
MPLTDTAIRNAKAGDKARKLFDGGGLYLEVAPSGGKWWRLKYRYGGKEKRLSLGVYPDVSLKDARDRRDEARKLLANDIDPSENRKATKAAKVERAANSFEAVAREWYAKHSPNWSANHGDRIIRRLERDIFPWLGGKPVADITAPQLLEVIRRIEQRGALETAHRALGNCGQVFRYAVATGRAERDPTGDLRGALPPVKGTHFASVTEPKKVAEVLRALDGYEGTLPVRCALRLAPLVFVRPGELRHAEWADIDLDAAEWRYTVKKTNTPHIVPLSRQAMDILRELHPLTGNGRYVFPSARNPRGDKPMSDNAILAAMRRMGISKEEMSGHGFRAMARTILDEVLGFRPDFIEHQLAHAVRDPNGRAYNRTAHLRERRKMMQKWADYLDKLKAGAEVIPMNQSA